MRAPPLARIAAVAAPRPDAEPVTIAHKPSLDIRISSYCFETLFEPAPACVYHIARQGPCKSTEIRSAEFILCLTNFVLRSAALAGSPADSACQGYGFSAS